MLVDRGLGEVLLRQFQAHLELMRGTGRTETLLEMVKGGDRVLFLHDREKKRFERILKDRNIEGVECLSGHPFGPRDLMTCGTSQGRTFFDHCWVEEYYRSNIESAQKNLDSLQQNLSGYWRAHLETRQRAEGIYRDRGFK